MLKRISNSSFFRENKVAGVYVEILSEDKLYCQVVILEKKKGSIHIVQKTESSLDKLSEVISVKIPLCVIIDGKGVLLRESKQENLIDEQLILQAFPNVTSSDYYVQHVESAQQTIFACFARRVTIDAIFENLKAQSFALLNVSLGVLPLSNIVSLKGKGKLIAFPYEITIVDGSLQKINKIKETSANFTVVGEESIPCTHVLAFASAFGYFMESNISKLNSEIFEQGLTDYSYQIIMKKGGFAFLIFLFVSLLLNFLIFSYQSDKQKQLSQELIQYQSTIEQLAAYKNEIAEKEKITQNGAWGSNTYFSYYADRIAASKPQGIVLQKMQLFPLTLKNKKFDLNGIRKDTIIIAGITKNSMLLNDWTKTLQAQKFIQHVSVTNYTQQESSSGNFTIEIALNKKKE
ncbi:MAG: hypothetical protein JXQ69_00965 [Paludibacteraceae bacterium]|nr:hypothetical protein [Paludibacteraceae bacterium]